MRILRLRLVLALLAVSATIATPAASGALRDKSGAEVPGTSGSVLDGSLGCDGATAQRLGCRPLANTIPLAGTEAASPAQPEDDLADALDAMAAATTATAAADARTRALAILEGTPVAGRAYSGIPLLNWNAPAKVKTVPAGGAVEVRQIRYAGQTISDTWLLDFEAPSQPFKIHYRITEFGSSIGGALQPAPLLADGGERIGGVQSLLEPLAVPSLATGAHIRSRFTDERGMGTTGAEETTRTAVQDVTVNMPPAGMVQAILEPGDRGGHSLGVLQPATAERRAAAAEAFAFSDTTPTDAERVAAIERLGIAAPERQIWDELTGLPAADDPAFLDAAKAAGEQNAQLVAVMRNRTQVPDGVGADPAADVTVTLMNAEAYVSRTTVRPGGAPVRVQVVNRDGFAQRLQAVALHTREKVHGPLDWGQFKWTPIDLGDDAELPAGGAGSSHTYSVDVPADAFALWIGNPGAGDQAGTVIELDRGPRTESLTPDHAPSAAPLHDAMGTDGDLWVTLSGVDKLVRIDPDADDLAASARQSVALPGGRTEASREGALLGPGDVAVDGRGIVWATLGIGNGIARIDPAKMRDGTTDGARVYELEPCGADGCVEPFVPEPEGVEPSREPLQMEVALDADGNTAVWFTELAADRIGLLRVSPQGDVLSEEHFNCVCRAPGGIALDAEGDVWFTEMVNNRIGRITPGVTAPWSPSHATLRHYHIPSAVPTVEPELSRDEIVTSNPHSVAIDRHGRVWFTESATGKLGRLDPAQAEPNTTRGMEELDVPRNEFGGEAVPADLAVDRENDIFWTDEYGDAVGQVHADGAKADWSVERLFRPGARRSLTDQPVLEPNGDLWFLETAGGLVTRVKGVSAGAPLPAAAPVIEAAPGGVSGSGLREVDAVKVTVRRNGAVADGREGIAVRDGAFSADVTVRAGDRVTVQPLGTHPHPPLSFTVAALDATVGANGRIEGTARSGSEALAGKVQVRWNGAHSAAIDPGDGSFELPVPDGAAPQSASLAWSFATAGAIYRTVAALEVPAGGDPDPDPGTVDPTPIPSTGGGSSTPSTGSSPAATPTPAPAVSTPTPKAPTASPEPRDPDCRDHVWLSASGGRRTPALLGLTAARLKACAGAPAHTGRRGKDDVWRVDRGLEVRLRSGRVVGFTLRGRGWSTRPGALGVGASATRLARLLGAVERRRTSLRAVLGHGRSAADVRVSVRSGRVTRIVVTLRSRGDLDAAGRRLLRRSG
jgi:streptogramin lyase